MVMADMAFAFTYFNLPASQMACKIAENVITSGPNIALDQEFLFLCN